jgi:serine/threonine-protein kinase RsbW
MHLEHEEVLLQIPGSPAYISVVRQAIGGLASRMPFTSQDVDDIKLAVGEACNNAVRHGYNDCGQPVRVLCRIMPECLQIEIRNHYCGEAPQKAIGETPDPQSYLEGGMGVFLMKTLVDQVDFRWGRSTATVRLTKHVRQHEAS